METCHINPKEQSIEVTTTTRITVKRKKEIAEKKDCYYLWLYPLYSESGTALEEQALVK